MTNCVNKMNYCCQICAGMSGLRMKVVLDKCWNEKCGCHIKETFKKETIKMIKENTEKNRYRDGETAFDIVKDIENL